MGPIALWLKVAMVSAMVLLETSTSLPAARVSSADANKTDRCTAAEYRQFDFWLGDWDAFDVGSSTPSARTRVDRILDGCVLLEHYEGADGHYGESFSIYDASRKVWHQSWVTNRGELLIIEGSLDGETMELSGVDKTPDGRERQVRGKWKPMQEGVRETAVTSTDGGKTWEPWFDIMFRAHKP